MERIKEALDRARQERGSETGWLEQGKLVNLPNQSPVPRFEEIEYTQTRTVTLSPKTLRANRVIRAPEQNGYSDAYKVLRTQVLHRMRERGANTLAITSPGAGEGKSLTALNLALSLALEVDKTVLLVDADMRNPTLNRLLGLGDVRGLSDYLTDGVPLNELLIHPGIPRLVVLPAGKRILNSSEMLSSQRMIKLVQEMKTRYPSRYVMFDLPPMLNVADATVFIPHVEAAIMVVEEGKTPTHAASNAAELIETDKLIGTVLNKVPEMQSVYASTAGTFSRWFSPRSA